MFMKHTISRFFRFFLVAALVAAMAGSLLPSKALGQVADVTVSASPQAAGEAAAWTIEFTTASPVLPDDGDANTDEDSAIELTFTGAAFPEFPVDDQDTAGVNEQEVAYMAFAAHITVESGDESGSPTTITSVSGTTGFTIGTPVVIGVEADPEATPAVEPAGGTATITIAVGAGITHATTVTPTSVEVDAGTGASASGSVETYNRPTVHTPETLNAGEVSEWEISSNNQATHELTENADRITVTFSSGSVPSVISRDDILVRTSDSDLDTDEEADSARLSVAPTVKGRTISFLSPVDSDTDAMVRIVISESAGVAAGNSPGTMGVTVKLGSNIAAISDAVAVGRYLNISPTKAARNATITVTGGGFAPGTSGGVNVGTGAPGAGTYSVDSSGKLTGSFVATRRTGGGGVVSVRDLGSNAVVEGPSFTQVASAVPAADEAARGASVGVSLFDFPSGSTYVVMLGGVDVSDDLSPTATAYSLKIKQSESPGTKQVAVTGTGTDGTSKTARFLLTIVSRVLTVSPSAAVPGQSMTVTGAGFTQRPGGGITVGLTLGDALLTGDVDVNAATPDVPAIQVNTDGTFLWTGKVPFNNETAEAGAAGTSGSLKWTATETTEGGRSASSSGFTIQKRSITLSPSTANPGATVEVFGSGWGVKTRQDVTSQVILTLDVGTGTTGTRYGPFPVSSTGEFTGAITVPSDAGVQSINVLAMDNNGLAEDGGTGGFAGNQSTSKKLRVPTGVIDVSPNTASTGETITISGTGFPAQTNLTMLQFGPSRALPVPAPATNVNGEFTVTITVPAASGGGSLPPGAVVITAKVQNISGTTSFTIPGPEISLSSGTARPGDSLTISGTGFSAFANVDSINFGSAPALPVPNPRTDGIGDFSASVIVPTLNPGAYTITVRTGAQFTATHSVQIVSASAGAALAPEDALRSLISREILTLASAASPGGTTFGAFVPGLAGNTLALIEPNGVLILTLNADARVSVSGQPAVDVTAGKPAFFALGSTVSVEVIE